MEPKPPYQYQSIVQPLTADGALEKRQIRIAVLAPGAWDDDLDLTLRTISLDDDKGGVSAEYEALSYVWGSPDDCLPVTLDGSFSLSITRNLHSALRHLRLDDKSRTIWADSICINQQDLVERSQQVRLMGDLYRNAGRVVAWLGPQADDSDLALELAESTARWFFTDEKKGILFQRAGIDAWELWDKWKQEPLNFPRIGMAREGEALRALLMRPWFERLWIKQECILADQKSLTVYCGHKTIPWKAFQLMTTVLSNRGATFYPLTTAENYQRNEQMTKRFLFAGNATRGEYTHIVDVMRFMSVRAKCSDPRDKIYGMMNLFTPPMPRQGPVRIVPDYTKPAAEIYSDFALQLINGGPVCCLHVLSYAGLSTQGATLDLPSWVPNWTGTQLDFWDAMSEAGTYVSSRASLPAPDTLRISGVAVSEVVAFLPMRDMSTLPLYLIPFNDVRDIFTILCREMLHLPIYRDRAHLLEEYCKVLHHSRFVEESWPEGGPLAELSLHNTFAEALRILTSIVDAPEEVAEKDILPEQAKLLDFCTGTMPYVAVAQDGRLARACRGVQVGDVFCAVPGCGSVLLLRMREAAAGASSSGQQQQQQPPPPPAGAKTATKTYSLVGPAYLAGTEKGEAVLGELPPGWEAKWAERPYSSSRYRVFRGPGMAADEAVRDDPRLRSLFADVFSSDPELGEDSPNYEEAFRRAGLVTVDMLREKGVKVEEFDLV